MRPPSLQVLIWALMHPGDLPEHWGPWGPSAHSCMGLVPAGTLWMLGKGHWPLPHTRGDTGGGGQHSSPSQQLWAVRVPGVRGSLRALLFCRARRDPRLSGQRLLPYLWLGKAELLKRCV